MARRKQTVPFFKRYRLRFFKKPPSAMWEALLLFLFVAVMVYGYSFAKKITYGAEAESTGPQEFVRVQVLNGFGAAGAASEVAERLIGDRSTSYHFDVVDQGNFATFDVRETIVLARGESADPARAVARLLGLGRDRVIEQPLSENVLDIEVTVLLGKDFETVSRKAKRRP
jgi:hypothetical protein